MHRCALRIGSGVSGAKTIVVKISGSESEICKFHPNLRRDTGKPAGSLRLLSVRPTEGGSLYVVSVAWRRSVANARRAGERPGQSAILAPDREKALAHLESFGSSDRCSDAPICYRHAARSALSEVRRH